MLKAVTVCLSLALGTHALRFSEGRKKATPEAALKDKSQSEMPQTLKAKSTEGLEMEYEMACTNDARKITRKNIEAKNWANLKKDVCMMGRADELQRLESGVGDAEDVGEWLDGDLKVPAASLRVVKTEEAEQAKEKVQYCKKLPSMIYIGMGHSGSTTLSMQLNAHPELSYGQMKEHRFHFDKGTNERNTGMYRKNFEIDCKKKAFDGSIGYIFYTEERIQALKEVLGPDVKILLMMRDPAKWMNSLYINGGDGLSKGHQGCYADFLETWLKYYPRENFLIESSEDYFKNPQSTIDRISKHAGVKKYTYPEKFLTHAAGRRRSTGMKKEKIAAYKSDPHNVECARRLQILSNRTFHWAEEMIKAAEKGEKLEK